jgi:hypothetical protein
MAIVKWIVFGALLTLTGSVAEAQIVSNGSFETGTATFGATNLFGFGATYNNQSIATGNTTIATGWTADFDTMGQGWLVKRPTGDPLIPSFGNRFVYLTGWESCYRNTVSLTVGQRYTISACVAGMDEDGTAGDEAAKFSFEMDADRNGSASYASEYSVQTIAAPDVKNSFSGAVWKTYSYTFTAGGSGSGTQNYTYWISALNNTPGDVRPGTAPQLGIALDCVDISLAAVPEPGTLALALLGGVPLLLNRYRRRSGNQPATAVAIASASMP